MFVSAGGETGGERLCSVEASWRADNPGHSGSRLQPLRSSHGENFIEILMLNDEGPVGGKQRCGKVLGTKSKME